MALAIGILSAPTTEMYTRCRTPARDAARTRCRALSSSPLVLPAQCTMISVPSTAASIPSPVARSACTHSAPGQSSPGLARRLIPRTGYPAALNCFTTRRPSLPAPPVTRICCIVFPLLFLCALHASLSEARTGDESARADVTPLWLFSVLLWAYNKGEGER